MKILIQIKAILIGGFALLCVLLPVCLIAAPFGIRRRLKIVSGAWKAFGHMVIRYACGANIRVLEDHRSPEFSGVPCSGLYISNHQSYLDIPMFCILYQAPPIMKKEVLRIPIFGWIAYLSGALPVSRSDSGSRRKVFEQAKKRIMKDNVGLGVYPEGTRSKDSFPKPFTEIKKTLLIFAFNEKIPVIATSVYGTRGILNKNGSVNSGKDVGMIVHKEIYPNDFKTADEFAEACWNKVITGHRQMKEKLEHQSGNLSLVSSLS